MEGRKRICPACGVQPVYKNGDYCISCKRKIAYDNAMSKHRERMDYSAKNIYEEYNRNAIRRAEEFDKLLSWCRKNGIAEIAKKYCNHKRQNDDGE